MWTYNFANPVFFKAREIKNSNVEFDCIIIYIPIVVFYNEMAHQI